MSAGFSRKKIHFFPRELGACKIVGKAREEKEEVGRSSQKSENCSQLLPTFQLKPDSRPESQEVSCYWCHCCRCLDCCMRKSRFCLLLAFQISRKCFCLMESQSISYWQDILGNVVPKLLALAAPRAYVQKSAGMLLSHSQCNIPLGIKAVVKMNFGQMMFRFRSWPLFFKILENLLLHICLFLYFTFLMSQAA